MSVYPDIITEVKSTVPLQWADNFRVLSTQFETGQENRRLIDGYVRRTVRVSYAPAKYEQANTLRRFYEDMRGPFESFSFFFPQIETFYKELAAVIRSPSSGSTTTFDLPSKDAQSFNLYRNGNVLTYGTDYYMTPAVPPDGVDRAGVYSCSTGDIFTWSFTGRLRIEARFASKPIVFNDSKTLFSYIASEIEGIYPKEVVG